jgi:hypothetical protein
MGHLHFDDSERRPMGLNPLEQREGHVVDGDAVRGMAFRFIAAKIIPT